MYNVSKKGISTMSNTEENKLDEKFFERADAHIDLANRHTNAQVHPDF